LETGDNGDIILTIKIGVRKFKFVLPAKKKEQEKKEDLEVDRELNDKMLEDRLLEIKTKFDNRLEQFEAKLIERTAQFTIQL